MTATVWVEAARTDDTGPDEPLAVTLNGRDNTLYTLEDGIYATDELCTHPIARLSDGFLEDGEFECPLYQDRFNDTPGKVLCDPVSEEIQTYAVKVNGGTVFVGGNGD